MKLQIATNYAVRILLHLYKHEDDVQAATVIAQSTGISYPFFMKIANQLKKKKLLISVQGRNGGFALGKPIQEISFYDVFLAMEGEMQINPCLNKEDQACTDDKLDHFLHNLRDKIVAKMSGQLIVDFALCAEQSRVRDLQDGSHQAQGEEPDL